jgi:uncharacterized protein
MPADPACPGRARPAVAFLVGQMVGLTMALVPVARGAEAFEFPPLTGRVVDAANLLDATTEASLTSELAAFERASGGTQIVVVTVPSLQGQGIEAYGYQLGRHWGIGARDEDTGALLLVAPAERQVRIEVGYGLEGQLTDAISWDIVQGRILPRFREDDLDGGVVEGARAMIAALGGDYELSAAGSPESDRRRLPAIIFWIFVAFILLSSFGGRRRGLGRALLLGSMLGGAGRGGGFSGGGGSFGGGGASGGW